MKNKFLFFGMLVIGSLLAFSSCKKDKDEDIQVSQQEVNGTFHAFEAQINDGPLTPMPNDGEKIDIKIKSLNKRQAKVLLIDHYQNNTDTLPFNCTIGKTDDGFTILNKKTANGTVSVNFYDKNTIDFFIVGGEQSVYVAASKSGKKPDWWE